jgi:SAM-dependent methyltransferase
MSVRIPVYDGTAIDYFGTAIRRQAVKSDKFYSSRFFAQHSPESLRSAELVVPFLMELVQPSSAIDVGCGTGAWLSVLAKSGVTDYLGIDGDWVNVDQLQINPRCFRNVNLADRFNLDRRFDLVLSLEVAEHLPIESAKVFIESLTRLGPVIAFSAAIPHQGGTSHVNEQWPEFWADLFARCGYHAVDVLRPRIWNIREVCYWYRQNMLLFVNQKEATILEKLRNDHLRGPGMPLNLVHPEYVLATHRFQANADLRHLWKRVPRATAQTIKKMCRKLLFCRSGKRGSRDRQLSEPIHALRK